MKEHLEAKTKQSKNSTIQITVNLASNIKPSNKEECLGLFSRTAPKFKLIEEKWRIIPFSVDAVAVIVEPINSTMVPFNDSCFFLPKPVRQPN